MTKKKPTKARKLELTKETLTDPAQLSDKELDRVAGGLTATCGGACQSGVSAACGVGAIATYACAAKPLSGLRACIG